MPDTVAAPDPASRPAAHSTPDAASDEVRNLADAVRRAARLTPDSAALVLPATVDRARGVVTWGEMDGRVEAVARALNRLGLPGANPTAMSVPGRTAARVAIVLPNVPELAYALFGALRAGLVAVPMNPGYTVRELRQQLTDSGASVIVTTEAVWASLSAIRPELPDLRHAYAVDSSPAGTATPFAELLAGGGSAYPESGGEDLAVLLYTSGTAGAPRAAMLSHRALIANHRQVARIGPPVVTAGDVVLLALPLFHAFGLNTGLGAIAWHGACGVLMDRFDPAESLRTIAQERVTVVTAVPQMYAAWAALPDLPARLASLRVAVSGAAPLGAAAAHSFFAASGLRLFDGYGLTETAPVVATSLASPTPKDGSIGRPVPGVELKLVDAAGTELARVTPEGLVGCGDDFDDDAGGVPGTDPGEVVVRGANLFDGYWPDGAGGPGPDGWWATGDVAYADADGDLFLVDRLREMIIVNGFNVYPREVELVLADHPGVREAAVVGVPSPATGEAVRAYVVRSAGASSSIAEGTGEPVTAAELRTYCEQNLARFKCPEEFEFVDELPYSATGKVRKGTLGEGRSGKRGAP